MSDAAIFVLVVAGLFVLRVVAATAVFFWILPSGDRCPNCDAVTLRIQNRWMDRALPWFRASWCYHCGWEGTLRRGELTPEPVSPARAPTPPPHKKLPNETSEA
jgi:hypothetical protein